MNVRLLSRLVRINGWRQVLARLFIEARVYIRYSTVRKLLNLVRVLWQYRRKSLVAQGYPYRYYIEPTNACNLRCPFCFGWQERSRRTWGTMGLDMFKSLVDEIAPYAYWIDLYNRGEPLLHADLCEMIAYAHERGIGTKIGSNLHNLDNHGAQRLVESGLDYLVVALDGATQESYANYRVGGDIRVVLQNLRALTACKRRLKTATPYITIRTLIMRQNENELGAIKAIAEELGVDNVIFTPMIVNIRGKDADQWLPSKPMHSFYDYERRCNTIARGNAACIELWSRGTINSDGRVFPCCFADGIGEELGNLTDSDFLNIWNNERYQASRAVFSDARPGKPSEVATVCTSCRGFRKTR